MRRTEFEAMVRRMAAEVPGEFLDGIAEVVVSPRAVPHPLREGIFTLGECIPLPAADSGIDGVQSRVVLYHGSFAALAATTDDFDWREEAWETLTHELRHHLEWRAREPALEALDEAAEQNYARQDGEPFEPLFYLDGETPAPGVFRVEDDYFLDRRVRTLPRDVEFVWHGRSYRIDLPAEAELPALLSVEGVVPSPPGELVLVLRRRPGLRDLFRAAPPFQATVQAQDLGPAPPAGPPTG